MTASELVVSAGPVLLAFQFFLHIRLALNFCGTLCDKWSFLRQSISVFFVFLFLIGKADRQDRKRQVVPER